MRLEPPIYRSTVRLANYYTSEQAVRERHSTVVNKYHTVMLDWF